MKKIGIYVHIPFCKQKCLYCDFISYSQKEYMQQKYVKSLIKEIEIWKQEHLDEKIETIYIGGGTPSYIDSKYIVQILEALLVKNRTAPICQLGKNGIGTKFLKDLVISYPEITIEVNPGTATEQKLQEYKKAGINRLSIGLQSTSNKLLKQIGRIHSYEEFLNTYKLARKVGFENINVDLMIGLPNQTIQDIKKSLEKILRLEPREPEHISVYSLIVEENTPMQKLIDNGTFELPDEEQERNMYWYVKNYLELNRIQTL